MPANESWNCLSLPEVVVEQLNDVNFRVRRACETGVNDAFVDIRVVPRERGTYIRVSSADRFANYAEHGERSRLPVGQESMIDVEAVILSPEQQLDAVQVLGALTFRCAEEPGAK